MNTFPLDKIEFDFPRDKPKAEQLIKEKIGPILSSAGYKWNRGNWWLKDLGWCVKRCSLSVTSVGKIKQPNALGGATIFLPKMHEVFHRTEDAPLAERSATIGAPIYSIDKRLDSSSGYFNSLSHLESSVLPPLVKAVEERVLPELEKYQAESDLFSDLMSRNWLHTVKFFATQDRRGALVALYLAKTEGASSGLEFATSEISRIRAEQPLIQSTAKYQDLLRVVAHLKQ